MVRFGLVISFCFVSAAFAMTVASINGNAQTVQSNEAGSDVEIRFDRGGVTLQCVCDGKVVPSSISSGVVSVSSIVKRETNETLNYRYTSSGGRIVGDGANVDWDFTDGYAPGEYSITVLVDNGIGTYSRAASRLITVAEPCCLCPCECPALAIASHEKQVKPGGRLSFEARVSGGPTQNIQYKWVVENGSITSGQGTPAIKVIASTKKGVAELIANLEISLEKDCGCQTSVSESVQIGARTIDRSVPSPDSAF